jgi:hypothetical protein
MRTFSCGRCPRRIPAYRDLSRARLRRVSSGPPCRTHQSTHQSRLPRWTGRRQTASLSDGASRARNGDPHEEDAERLGGRVGPGLRVGSRARSALRQLADRLADQTSFRARRRPMRLHGGRHAARLPPRAGGSGDDAVRAEPVRHGVPQRGRLAISQNLQGLAAIRWSLKRSCVTARGESGG